MKIGRLIARVVIGGLFVGHGTQKWFGWFGGPGLAGASQSMDALGLRPGRTNAIAASVSETAGGALLAAGALTPVAAATLIATMITAVRTAHLKNGPWASKGGYEYNLVLIAALLTLVDGGPESSRWTACSGSTRRAAHGRSRPSRAGSRARRSRSRPDAATRAAFDGPRRRPERSSPNTGSIAPSTAGTGTRSPPRMASCRRLRLGAGEPELPQPEASLRGPAGQIDRADGTR